MVAVGEQARRRNRCSWIERLEVAGKAPGGAQSLGVICGATVRRLRRPGEGQFGGHHVVALCFAVVHEVAQPTPGVGEGVAELATHVEVVDQLLVQRLHDELTSEMWVADALGHG